jgi:nucleotide-binding universal stress UspA family protein
MYQHLLIATDGSELAAAAVAQGIELAKRLGARVTIVTVTEPPGFATLPTPEFLDAYEKAVTEQAASILTAAGERAKEQGVACATLHVRDRFVAEAIGTTASEQHCDLIVMASHGRRGVAKVLLGSETMRVLSLSNLPVLVCR